MLRWVGNCWTPVSWAKRRLPRLGGQSGHPRQCEAQMCRAVSCASFSLCRDMHIFTCLDINQPAYATYLTMIFVVMFLLFGEFVFEIYWHTTSTSFSKAQTEWFTFKNCTPCLRCSAQRCWGLWAGPHLTFSSKNWEKELSKENWEKELKKKNWRKVMKDWIVDVNLCLVIWLPGPRRHQL